MWEIFVYRECMDIVIKSILLLKVIFADPEGDGSYNYLFEHKSRIGQSYSIAHSYSDDMKLEPGSEFYAMVVAKCQEVWALDPTPKVLEEVYPWGIPRRFRICTADSLTINGKTYISLVRKP